MKMKNIAIYGNAFNGTAVIDGVEYPVYGNWHKGRYDFNLPAIYMDVYKVWIRTRGGGPEICMWYQPVEANLSAPPSGWWPDRLRPWEYGRKKLSSFENDAKRILESTGRRLRDMSGYEILHPDEKEERV